MWDVNDGSETPLEPMPIARRRHRRSSQALPPRVSELRASRDRSDLAAPNRSDLAVPNRSDLAASNRSELREVNRANERRTQRSANRRAKPQPSSSAANRSRTTPLRPVPERATRVLRAEAPAQKAPRLRSASVANPLRVAQSTNRRLATVPSASKVSRFVGQDSAKPVAMARREPKLNPPRPRTRSGLALLYGARLLILGVGVGVIAGTILSVWDPARFTAGASSEKTEQATPSPESKLALPQLQLSQEILPLKTQLQALATPLTQLTPGVMIVDLDTQSFIDINAATAFPAASTIKFPILVAFFQDVDAGKIRLDEMLTMRKELVATESGDLQYQPVGSQFSALEVATRMIDMSDNTATNMIIDRLGGKDALNQRFQTWGLSNTAVQNLLPDLNGTNTSSPRDMVTLLGLVNSGQLMSLRSLERMLDIMRNVANNSLLPQGLGQGAKIAHKTGDIGSMLGDVGLIDMPNGKRYLIAAMVKRPHNDDRAGDLVRQVSKVTYQYFTQAGAATRANPAPTASPTDSQGAAPERSRIAQP